VKYPSIVAVVLLFLFQANVVLAASAIQGRVGINHSESEDDDNDKDKHTNVNLEFYFTPVERNNHPWREAAFLEHAASVEFEVGKRSLEPEGSETYDGPSFFIGGTYASKSNPLIVSLAYANEDISADFGAFGKSKRETSGYGLGLGAYISKGLAFQAFYVDTEVKDTVEIAPVLNTEYNLVQYGVRAKYVQVFANSQALNIELNGSIFDYEEQGNPSESNNSVEIDATYYINQKVGVFGMLDLRSGDTDSYKGTEYGVGVDAFVIENLSFTLEYKTFNADSSNGVDEDQWSVAAEWWF
jgi:hypothetical protein